MKIFRTGKDFRFLLPILSILGLKGNNDKLF